MPTIIDGYNLLHASGILGQGRGPGYFERSRTALLNFLAESLPAEEVARTTVVFDAAAAPPGLASTWAHRGITVHFARDRASADELIAELIQASTSPRKLTVVSSDHAVQRAARRRRATAIDSDEWLWLARQARQQRPHRAAPAPVDQREAALTGEQVDYWLRAFGLVVEPEPPADARSAEDNPSSESVSTIGTWSASRSKSKQPAAPSPAGKKTDQIKKQPPVPDLAQRKPPERKRRPARRPARDRPIPHKRAGEPLFPPGYADDVGDEP
jgi:hypothetical protein